MEQHFSRQVGVNAMAGDERRTLERLLGHPLEDDGQVYILAFKPAGADESARREALLSMRQTFAAAAEHASEHAIDDDEIDAAVDEAMQHVRYGQQ